MDIRKLHELNNTGNWSLDRSSEEDDDDISVVSVGGSRYKGLNRIMSLGRGSQLSNEPRHHEPRRSSLTTLVGQGVKNTLMAPVVASRFAVNMGVKSTQAVANATVKSTQAVANATVKSTQAVAHVTTKTVVAGAKGVVGGGKALMDGTGAVVGYGGKTMLSGAKGVVKITKAPWKSINKGKSQSKWEQSIECIDSLLDPDSATYRAMTPEQRQQLVKVKKLLLKGPGTNSNLNQATEAEKIAHVPMELLKEEKQMRKSSMASTSSADPASAKNYILQEFAGVRNGSVLENLSEETSEDSSTSKAYEDESVMEAVFDEASVKPVEKTPAAKKAAATAKRRKQSLSTKESMFVPPEFTGLSRKDQKSVYDMLSWESLSTWGYDIFELDAVTNGNALLFVSWSIVAYPHAQQAMAQACGQEPGDFSDTVGRYSFVEEFGIVPATLCNYVRAVQAAYHEENPYHNAIHAADVVQTLHTLIQMRGGTTETFDPLDLLAILLSAIVHDMDHPGNTNGFHTNLRTELAVMYNDTSVLENWHIARAFACMLGLSLQEASQQQYEALVAPNRPSERNILSNVEKEDFDKIRNRMIEAVLHTDMTKHFAMVNGVKGLLLEAENEETTDTTWQVFMFMLHLADISSQAKPDPLFRHWTVRCMDEFFDQGELEERFGLPVSPNCDRDATNIAEAQTGFMKFVIGPAYEVLAGFIPVLESEVLPIIADNLNTWMSEA